MAGAMHGKGVCMAWDMHSRKENHCSRQYASYWNAFLFVITFFVGHKSRIYHKKGNVSIYFY